MSSSHWAVFPGFCVRHMVKADPKPDVAAMLRWIKMKAGEDRQNLAHATNINAFTGDTYGNGQKVWLKLAEVHKEWEQYARSKTTQFGFAM